MECDNRKVKERERERCMSWLGGNLDRQVRVSTSDSRKENERDYDRRPRTKKNYASDQATAQFGGEVQITVKE